MDGFLAESNIVGEGSVYRLFIAWVHLLMVKVGGVSGGSSLSRILLSFLIFQIRYADSETRIR